MDIAERERQHARMVSTPSDHAGAVIAERLLQYLRNATRDPALAYADAPVRLAGGFEAAIFGFRLAGAKPPFEGPLVLRLFRATRHPEVVRRETVVQNALTQLNYPAARVVASETEPSILGGPFLIMERLPGQLLGARFVGLGAGRSILGIVRLLLDLPRSTRRMVALWCEAQVALHALPVADFARALEAAGVASAPFSFETQLAMTEQYIAEGGLKGLAPAIAWLGVNRPAPVAPAICHGDLHPFNIMVEENRIAGVIDWGGLAIADPALDLGTTLGAGAALPLAVPRALRPLLRAVLRAISRSLVRAYCRAHPLDAASLRYFQVYSCLRQLIWVGLGAVAGEPRVGGFGSPDGVRNLIAHIRALTGVAVELPAIAWQ